MRRLRSTSPTCTHWRVSSQTFCVTHTPFPWDLGISSAFPSCAKAAALHRLPGFGGAEQAHEHRLSSSWAELLTPQWQPRVQIWIQFLLAFLYEKMMVQILARVTILSVQMVCRITKLAAINSTKFALHWSSKECAGRPGVGPPVCSVLFGILVTLLPAGWPEGLGPYRQVNQSKKK